MQTLIPLPTNAQTLNQIPCETAQEPPTSELKILSRISAGFPSPAIDYVEDSLDLNDYLVRNKSSTYLFTVKGDSMCGACVAEGDKILVDRSRPPRHGDIVVAIVDDEYTVKRLFRKDGRTELHPENTAYLPITFSDGQELTIWGVVVGVARRY
jgi:DNA polymerase V